MVRVFDRALQNSITIAPLACESSTNSITVTAEGAVGINLVSNATNETFCDGQEVIFEATSIVSATYAFFVGPTLRQAASSSNTFSVNNLVDGDNVRVIVSFVSGCSATRSLTLIKNDIITAGTISPSLQRVCFNTVPNQLTSLTTATVNNVSSTCLLYTSDAADE